MGVLSWAWTSNDAPPPARAEAADPAKVHHLHALPEHGPGAVSLVLRPRDVPPPPPDSARGEAHGRAGQPERRERRRAEGMTATLSDGTRRFDAAPWEPVGLVFDGHGGHSDLKGMQAALLREAPRYGIHSSRATTETKSGLTRRGVIYEYVRRHPGNHVRGMCKDLKLATGDLQYHLLWLEKHGFVKTRKNGFYRF